MQNRGLGLAVQDGNHRSCGLLWPSFDPQSVSLLLLAMDQEACRSFRETSEGERESGLL